MQTGQCLCGAVTFTADSAEQHIHACHCSTCRTWSGGPALAAEASGVVFADGAPIKRYQSSEWAERGFCTECGTHLFYHLLGTERYILWSGVFDDPGQFELTGEIFIDEKTPGFEFAGDHPRLTGEQVMASESPPEG